MMPFFLPALVLSFTGSFDPISVSPLASISVNAFICAIASAAISAIAFTSGRTSANGIAIFSAIASTIAIAVASANPFTLILTIAIVIFIGSVLVKTSVSALKHFTYIAVQKKMVAARQRKLSRIYFLLDEEQRRHLIDLRQQWWKETPSLTPFHRRWIVRGKTQWYHIQCFRAIAVIKLQEFFQLHRLL